MFHSYYVKVQAKLVELLKLPSELSRWVDALDLIQAKWPLELVEGVQKRIGHPAE